MPFDFGAFAGGLAQGLHQGQQLALQKKEAELRSKMIDAQMKHLDFQNQQAVSAIEQHQRAQRIADETASAYDAAATGGTQAQPGYESPEQQMSVAPISAQRGSGQMSPNQILTRGAIQQGKFPAGAFNTAAQPDLEKQLESLQKYGLIQPGGGDSGGSGGMETGFTISPKTGVTTRINPVKQGVGVEAQTWSRVVKENPGADLATLRERYNQEVGKTAGVRAGSATTSKIEAAATPTALGQQTATAGAKTAGGPLTAGVEDVLAKGDVLGKTVADIRANYDPNYLGPIKGTDMAFEGRRRIGSAIGMPTEDKEVKFRQSLGDAKNQIIYLMSGKQINEAEGRRLIDQMPKSTDEPQTFLAGLDRFEQQVQRAVAAHKQAGTATRSTVQGLATPSQPSSRPNASVGTTKTLAGKTFRKTGPGELDWDVVQ